MTITNVLAPDPFWTIIDNVGLLAGGALLYTRSSLNPSQDKAAYVDPAGTIPYENPIEFDLNGTNPPIYWKVDDSNPDDLYFLRATDADGTELWTVNDWPQGVGTGGGGTNIITYTSLRNFINNGVFQDNTGATASPIAQQHTKIAPSNHKGFTPAESGPIVSNTTGIMASDIWFTKSNTAANDQITYPEFPLGFTFTDDVCPAFYLRYVCTNAAIGEVYKCFQFPINQKVQNLTNKKMTFQFWAIAASPVDVKVFVKQYFGSAPSADTGIRTQEGVTINLSNSWTKYNVPFTVPTVGGKSVGTVNFQTDDDALYMQLEMPLVTICDIGMTKFAFRLGDVKFGDDFDTYDQIDTINQSPRTGDIRIGYSAAPPPGWVGCDTSIGNIGSGALPDNQANKNTFQLYATLYTNVSNTYATVSGGRTGTTVADAVTDFIANKKMTLMPVLGRAIGAAGAGSGLTVRTLGQTFGTETHTLLAGELPPHAHNMTVPSGDPGGEQAVAQGLIVSTVNLGNTGNGPGSSTPFSIMQPTAFTNFYIKL